MLWMRRYPPYYVKCFECLEKCYINVTGLDEDTSGDFHEKKGENKKKLSKTENKQGKKTQLTFCFFRSVVLSHPPLDGETRKRGDVEFLNIKGYLMIM